MQQHIKNRWLASISGTAAFLSLLIFIGLLLSNITLPQFILWGACSCANSWMFYYWMKKEMGGC